jgi:hypothetical protein
MDALSSTIQTFTEDANNLLKTDVNLLTKPSYSDIAKVACAITTFQERSFALNNSWNRMVLEIQAGQAELTEELIILAERCSHIMLSIYGERRFSGIALQGARLANELREQIESLKAQHAADRAADALIEDEALPLQAVASAEEASREATSFSLFNSFKHYLDHHSILLGPAMRAVVRGADYIMNRSYTKEALGFLKEIGDPTREAQEAETALLVAAATADFDTGED